MGAKNVGTTAEVDTFFFKENNHFSGKHYYAILESSGMEQKLILMI